jgi:hypothetical protein
MAARLDLARIEAALRDIDADADTEPLSLGDALPLRTPLARADAEADPDADAPRLTVDLAHAQPFAAVAWAAEDELWTLGVDGVALKRSITA